MNFYLFAGAALLAWAPVLPLLTNGSTQVAAAQDDPIEPPPTETPRNPIAPGKGGTSEPAPAAEPAPSAEPVTDPNPSEPAPIAEPVTDPNSSEPAPVSVPVVEPIPQSEPAPITCARGRQSVVVAQLRNQQGAVFWPVDHAVLVGNTP